MSLQKKRNSLIAELKMREESATKIFNDYIAWRIAQRQFQKRLVQIGTITKNKQAIDGEVSVVEAMMKQLKVSESRVREQFNASNVYYEAEMNRELKPVVVVIWFHLAIDRDFRVVAEAQGIGTETERLPAVKSLKRV